MQEEPILNFKLWDSPLMLDDDPDLSDICHERI